MATVHPHWCDIASTVAYLGSLAYCATLDGSIDRDHCTLVKLNSLNIASY